MYHEKKSEKSMQSGYTSKNIPKVRLPPRQCVVLVQMRGGRGSLDSRVAPVSTKVMLMRAASGQIRVRARRAQQRLDVCVHDGAAE